MNYWRNILVKLKILKKIITVQDIVNSYKYKEKSRFPNVIIKDKSFNGSIDNPINLSNINFQGADLRGIDFSYVYLTNANLRGANFANAELKGANLEGADIRGTNFTNAKLNGANLTNTIVGISNISSCIGYLFLSTGFALSAFGFAFASWCISIFVLPEIINTHAFHAIFSILAFILLLCIISIPKIKIELKIFAPILGYWGVIILFAAFYGILNSAKNSVSISVLLVTCLSAMAVGFLTSVYIGAGTLKYIKDLIELNLKKNLKLQKCITKLTINQKISTLANIITSIAIIPALLIMWYGTTESARVVIDSGAVNTADVLAYYDAVDRVIFITGIGGIVSILCSLFIILKIEQIKYKSIQDFTNRLSVFSFNNCRLSFYQGSNFYSADLTDANFTNVDFYFMSLEKANTIRTNWKNTKGHDRVWSWVSNLEDKLIRSLVVHKQSGVTNFTDRDLRGVNLQGADLKGVCFDRSDLTNATLENATLEGASFIDADLRGVNLQGVDLKGVDFDRSDLTNATLENATLEGASFIDANLSNVNLQGANLEKAKLVRTSLHDADLTGTRMTGAIIETWGITSTTKLENIDCKYVYMKLADEDEELEQYRELDHREFRENEFVKFVKQYFDTLIFYHSNNFDFPSAILAIKELYQKYPDAKINFIGLRKVGEGWKMEVETDKDAFINRKELREEYWFNYYCFFLIQSKDKKRPRLLPSSKGRTRREYRIRINFKQGNLEAGFSDVEVMLFDPNTNYPSDKIGSLPSQSQILNSYKELNDMLEESKTRAKKKRKTISNLSGKNVSDILTEKTKEESKKEAEIKKEIENKFQELEKKINENFVFSKEFSPIVKFIMENLPSIEEIQKDDEIMFCFQTAINQRNDEIADIDFRRIPWHLGQIFSQYPQAEIAFVRSNSQPPYREKTHERNCVRVLSILGDKEGINLNQDKEYLKDYLLDQRSTPIELEFLEQESRTIVEKQLRNEKGWDIISFSGHSSTDWNELSINNNGEFINSEDFKKFLEIAVRKGLQLVILNSCNSLRLVKDLEHLYIPAIIVMREPLPDYIAHEFLKNFLKVFVQGDSITTALRKTRDILKEKYPIESCIPALCYNRTEQLVTWDSLPGFSPNLRN